MANCELPEDAVFLILLVLPVASLLRFRSVCRSWCTLIDSSTFITKHLLLHQEHDDSLIMFNQSDKKWYLLSAEHHLCTDISAYLPLNQQIYAQPWDAMRMVGSCNGLVCIQDILFDHVALWNPATRKLTCIPDSPVPTRLGHDRGSKYGFGYDVKTNVYKVIKITQLRDKTDNRIEIYNVQADSWRTYDADLLGTAADSWRNYDADLLGTAAELLDKITGSNGVYCNGIYCWTICYSSFDGVYQTHFSILSFDLSNEVLGLTDFPEPDVLSANFDTALDLSVVTDCIAFVDNLGFWQSNPQYRHFDIWVLKEYGIKESWTKLYTIGPIGPLYSVLQTGFFSKGDFFLFMFEEEMENQDKFLLASCDPIVLDMQYLEVPHSGYGVPSVFVYKESLVSVKRGNAESNKV